MEPEIPENVENDFSVKLNTCGSCKQNVKGNCSKLLQCLHAVCPTCLSELGHSNRDESGNYVVKCPICSQDSIVSYIIDNLFSTSFKSHTTSDGISEAGQTVKDGDSCTGCEENTCTSYCMDCGEYLCDQCVQAHRRVRITKDHNIEPKSDVCHETPSDTEHHVMYCPLHKKEELKLYCVTCEKLTCRDCQLSEHKDHHYQFLSEAAEDYRKSLGHVLNKIREKKSYVENARALIEKRSSEITEREIKTAADIKTFVMKIATELNKRGKQLMIDLQNICKGKKGQLEQKSGEVNDLARALNHALQFGEYSLEKNDCGALLYSRKILIDQLKCILKTKCEVPNPHHVIDMKFGYDPNTPLSRIQQVGAIYVEGVPFNKKVPQVSHAFNHSQSTQHLGVNYPNHIPSVLTNASSAAVQRQRCSKSSLSQQDIGNFSSNQKALLLLKMQRMREHQRQQQFPYHSSSHHPVSHQIQSTSLSSSTGKDNLKMISRGHNQPLSDSYLPPQSSCISSSNGQRLHTQHFYQPLADASQQMQQNCSEDLIRINLGKLQERQMQQLHSECLPRPPDSFIGQHHISSTNSNNTMQNPIVIQPTNEFTSGMMTANASPQHDQIGHFTDILLNMDAEQSYKREFQDAFKANEMDHPSCSFTSSCYSKPNHTSSNPDNNATFEYSAVSTTRSLSSGSRTPTPCADSPTVNGDNSESRLPQDSISIDSDLSNITCSASTLQSLVDDASFDDFYSGITISDPDKDQNLVGENSLYQQSENITEIAATFPNQQDDPSEDWCAVCNNGGDLLCCDSCPKVFHLNCHIPSLKSPPSEDWYCGLCTKDELLYLKNPDPERTADNTALTKKEQRVCERILLELFCNHATIPFQDPVSDTVPNYYRIIKSPMDLSTAKKKLEGNFYITLESFLQDIQLVFSNCAIYNLPDSEVGQAGKTAEALFHVQLKRLLPFVQITSLKTNVFINSTDDTEDEDGSVRKRKICQDVSSDEDWMDYGPHVHENISGLKKKTKRRKGDSNNDNNPVHIQ